MYVLYSEYYYVCSDCQGFDFEKYFDVFVYMYLHAYLYTCVAIFL